LEEIMSFIETLIDRNAEFAKTGFSADLKIIPSQRTMIIGCVDPRVDPMDVLKLRPGEAAIIRNVGGRVTPALLEMMSLLGTVSKAAGNEVGAGWNLILLHHTNCGIIGCHHHAHDALAKHMGVQPDALDQLEITDPYKSVKVDIAALRANPRFPGGFTVAGLVYDVATGIIETVVPPATLRPAEA
jgi:carbonic anhydrase